jgi:hypothetical protein
MIRDDPLTIKIEKVGVIKVNKFLYLRDHEIRDIIIHYYESGIRNILPV